MVCLPYLLIYKLLLTTQNLLLNFKRIFNFSPSFKLYHIFDSCLYVIGQKDANEYVRETNT